MAESSALRLRLGGCATGQVTGPHHVLRSESRLGFPNRAMLNTNSRRTLGNSGNRTHEILSSKRKNRGSTHSKLTIGIRFAKDGTREDYSHRINLVSRNYERSMNSSGDPHPDCWRKRSSPFPRKSQNLFCISSCSGSDVGSRLCRRRRAIDDYIESQNGESSSRDQVQPYLSWMIAGW